MTTFNFFSPDFRKMRGIPCGTSDEPLVSHRLQSRQIFSFASLSKANGGECESRAKGEARKKINACQRSFLARDSQFALASVH